MCVTVRYIYQTRITTLPINIPESLTCEKVLDVGRLFLNDCNIYGTVL